MKKFFIKSQIFFKITLWVFKNKNPGGVAKRSTQCTSDKQFIFEFLVSVNVNGNGSVEDEC